MNSANNNFSNNNFSNNNNDNIGPCFPRNKLYYNPFSLKLDKYDYIAQFSNIIGEIDKCDDDMVLVNNMHDRYDLFSEPFEIASDDEMFLKQIYKIYNIQNVNEFLLSSIDTLPVNTQKRILNAIFNVYFGYVEFPKKIYIDKMLIVLKEIYNIDDNHTEQYLYNELKNIYEENVNQGKIFKSFKSFNLLDYIQEFYN